MASRNYQDLHAWQRAVEFVVLVYRLTKGFPKEERYGLTAQLRRAAVSIPSNVAEGQGRGGDPDFVRFLRFAYGSLREAETQIIIAERLGYLPSAESQKAIVLAAEVGRLINGLLKSKGG